MIDDEYQPYDRSSKWLIQHHGDSMLWLAQIKDLEAWRPAQAQVVQPTQIPDGLLEARRRGQPRDDLVLLEAATYPERRVVRQMTRDLMLVYLDRNELPEAVALVLRPKGTYRVPSGRNLRSRGGLSSCRLKWRVVELWTIPAEELLRAQDVGLIPWVPLTAFADPPETMLRRCREAIEEQAPPGEKANLLAVIQVFTFLRYNDEGLLTILGGKDVMLKVPFLDEIVKEKTQEAVRAAEVAAREVAQEAAREVAQEAARVAAREAVRENLVTVLEARFGNVPRDLTDEIGSIGDAKQLKSLVRSAVACPDLDAFRDALARR
jgi:predicted transposase YdaD